jgi:hypothetical protein
MLAMYFNRGRSYLVERRVVSEPYQKRLVRHENSMSLPLIMRTKFVCKCLQPGATEILPNLLSEPVKERFVYFLSL